MTLRDDHHATRERSPPCPTIGQEAVHELSAVDVIDREGYAELEVDAKVELIRSLIPLGLMHIEELLDDAGWRTLRPQSVSRRAPHGSNPGTVGLAAAVPFACPGAMSRSDEIPLRENGDRSQ